MGSGTLLFHWLHVPKLLQTCVYYMCVRCKELGL